jgi:hypothetical protein
MDLRLSNDIYESFRIFQGRLLEQYLAMSTEFNFTVIDANEPVEIQQAVVRQLVSRRVDLSAYKRQKRCRHPSPGRPHKPKSSSSRRKWNEATQPTTITSSFRRAASALFSGTGFPAFTSMSSAAS